MNWLIFWIVCGCIAAAIGSKKGEGVAGFFIGLLLGPLGIVFALISTGKNVKCPFCNVQRQLQMVRGDN